MDKFLSEAFTGYWWISVVVMGIFINVLSTYMKTPLDSLFGAISKSWRDRSVKARAARKQLIKDLLDRPMLFEAYKVKMQTQRHRDYLLIGLACFQGIMLVMFRLDPSVQAKVGLLTFNTLTFVMSMVMGMCVFISLGMFRSSTFDETVIYDVLEIKDMAS